MTFAFASNYYQILSFRFLCHSIFLIPEHVSVDLHVARFYGQFIRDPYVAKNIQQVEMIQRRAARWVLRRYDRLDSVTDMLSSLKWRSLELRRSDARLCMLYKQNNGLATYECDKLQKEHNSRMGKQALVSQSSI